jgi:hypothetical protein
VIRLTALATVVFIGAAAPALSVGGDRRLPCPDVRLAPEGSESLVDPVNARRFVGMTVRHARRLGRAHDCLVRVVRRNGEDLIVTTDFRTDRANVAVRDHRITRVVGIG